jgi:predicted ATPase/class 3 adenylate cyclase
MMPHGGVSRQAARCVKEPGSPLLRPDGMQGKLRPMGTLPLEPVTFLFTDIEGSTKLLHAVGPAGYAALQATHRTILRGAMSAGSGSEVDTQGDAFFFSFPDPIEAVLSAERGRQALAEHPWPDGHEIRVRMGMHVGTPVRTDEGYVGEDVNRGARIGALGAGGQIVLSEELASIVWARADLRERVVDLGIHRLKDFDRAERLFQLGDKTFPPIRSIGVLSLPEPSTSFVGRQDDLYAALSVVLEERPRLLTIHGPGGVGKTRFSIELAKVLRDEYPGGSFFVELAPLTDASMVLSGVAEVLGVTSPTADAAAIADRVGSTPTMMLLDNAEHLLEAASDVATLLRQAPTLAMIVTSRSPLTITAERVFELSPLPDDTSSTLFLERARSAGRPLERSPEVDQLCRRLDGLPLAIELAAARTSTFSPAQLVGMLESQPALLRGPRDADARHQTLVDTVRWSVDLLSDEERDLFGALSVFAGGCTWEAAEAVCGADPRALAVLVDNSLVRRTDELEPRYWLLETIRSVAAMQLAASGEAPELDRRLEEWLIRVTEGSEGPWIAPRWATSEVDNLRAAIRSAMETGRAGHAFTLLFDTWMFWLFTGRAAEGERMWHQLLENEDLLSREAFGEGISLLAEYARFMGKTDRALELQRRAIELNEFVTEASLAGTLHDHCETLASLGRFEEAKAIGRRALEIRRRIGETAGIAHAMEALATVEESRGAWARALEIHGEALPLARYPRFSHGIELGMAIDYLHLDRPAEAFSRLCALVLRVDLHDDLDLFSEVTGVLAHVTAGRGEWVLATRLLGAGAAIRQASGLSPGHLLDLGALGRDLSAVLPHVEYERELVLWSTCSLDEAHELVMASSSNRPTDRPASGSRDP